MVGFGHFCSYLLFLLKQTTACLTEVPANEEVSILEIPPPGLRVHPTSSTPSRLGPHRPTMASVGSGAGSPLRHHRQGSFGDPTFEDAGADEQHSLQRRTSGSPKPALHVHHHHHHHEDDGTSSRGHRRWIEFCRSNESLTSPLSWSACLLLAERLCPAMAWCRGTVGRCSSYSILWPDHPPLLLRCLITGHSMHAPTAPIRRTWLC